jgi:hypothetical protein
MGQNANPGPAEGRKVQCDSFRSFRNTLPNCNVAPREPQRSRATRRIYGIAQFGSDATEINRQFSQDSIVVPNP